MPPPSRKTNYHKRPPHAQEVQIILRTNPHCYISTHVGWTDEPCRCVEVKKVLCRECLEAGVLPRAVVIQPKLTDRQRLALDVLLLGGSGVEAARAAGISKATLYAWRLKHPSFKQVQASR